MNKKTTVSKQELSQRANKAWETRRKNGWTHPSKRSGYGYYRDNTKKEDLFIMINDMRDILDKMEDRLMQDADIPKKKTKFVPYEHDIEESFGRR